MTEAEVTRRCCKLLDSHGIWHVRYNAGHSGYSKTRKGIPDRVACYRGLFVGIEFKSSVGRLRPEQEMVREEIERAGGLYLVCRSEEDLKRGLGL